MTTAAVRRLAIPAPEDLIGRARSMVPEIRALAEETERNRNVSPHIIDKIRDVTPLAWSRAGSIRLGVKIYAFLIVIPANAGIQRLPDPASVG
jgi:hypothetical protein